MPIINEFFNINCSVKNWAQKLDTYLHQYACGMNANEYGEGDEAAGAVLYDRREVEARFLNVLLGTDYTGNSLILPDCREAEGGICVYTRSEGSSNITVDVFKPRQGYYRKSWYLTDVSGRVNAEGSEETVFNDSAKIASLGIHILRFPMTRWIAEASVALAGLMSEWLIGGNSRYPHEFPTDGPLEVPEAAPVVAKTHRRTYREALPCWESDGDTSTAGGRLGRTCR
jgi:hypothetical protein